MAGESSRVLGQPARGRCAEISSGQGRSPPGRVRDRSARRRVLLAYDRDRPADQRRLAELHGVADDAVEDVVVADDPQLVEHVAREVRPAVVERRQQAEDPQVAVQT